ncbi:MAG: transcriptional regulator, PadR-like family [Acidimicrobiales bacterium]|jgi:DNA-binding PadR family transcriptional regulator|nr:transcriptional regulator, PadR-like family [Acidimicrobiales bacterium]
MAGASQPDLSVTDWAVLGVIGEGRTHGFAVGRELGAGGDLGRVWTVHRPIVYRSLAHLERVGLIEPVASVAGAGGPQKTVMRITPAGRRRLRRWLEEPVDHVRDVRSQLLLKLALLDRGGRDPAVLVRRQRATIAAVVERLAAQARASTGFDAVVARWRLESARAVQRFLASLE